MSLSYFVTMKGCYIWKRVQGIVWQCIRMISLFMEWKFSEDVFLCRDDFLKTLSLPTEEFLVPCSFNAVYRVICPLMWNIVSLTAIYSGYATLVQITNMLAILVSFMNQILLNTYSHAYFKFKQKYLVISLFLCVFVLFFFLWGGGGSYLAVFC